MGEEKSQVELAMEKDCIYLVFAARIRDNKGDTKCLGPACGQFAEFISKCGFAK